MKVYTPEDLASADGKNGHAALVAVDGNVYDVSKSMKWPEGRHMKRHHAGMNLSSEIKSAPHGPEVLERFKMVGEYREAPKASAAGFKGNVEMWLERRPFFRRHPHPAVVHVPIGLLAVAPLFEIIALALGSECTEWAAYCCTLMALLTIPAAIGAGYFTWWINYDARDSPTIRAKSRLAWIVLIIAALAVSFRSLVIDAPLASHDLSVVAYAAALVVLAALIGYVGFLGGRLTFPYD